MAWDWLYLSLLISRKCLVQSTWCQSWYSSSSWWHLIRAKIGAFLTIRLVRWMWSILTQWESKELRFLDKTKSKSLLLRFHFEVPEASNFFTNSTIAVVPENAGTRKLAEMLSRELPNVEFSFYQVETSANLWQLQCPPDCLEWSGVGEPSERKSDEFQNQICPGLCPTSRATRVGLKGNL